MMKKNHHRSKAFIWIYGVLLALSLTACGSGGGSDSMAATGLLTDSGTGTDTSSAVASTGSTTIPLVINSVVPGTLLPGASGSGGSGTGAPGGSTSGNSGSGSSGATGSPVGPMILSSNPSQGAVNVPLSIVGANNTVTATPISATFSEAMNPASLVTPATTFTLKTSVSGQNVTGQVGLNASNTVATFTPANNLSANTQYTVTVTTGATNTAGTPLISTYAWFFTTGAGGSIGQAPIDMGTAAAFVALGGTAIENFGTNERRTHVNGQLGVYQDSATVVKGFTDSNPVGLGVIATGGIQTNPAMVPVEADFRKAVAEATNRTLNQTRIGITDLALTQIGSSTPGTFPPGLYTSGSATLMLNAGNLTLDAQGNTDAVWVFKADSSFIVGDSRQIMLINGARANQVFWVVGSSVTVGDGVAFKGNILAGSSITLGTSAMSGTTLEGRAMSASSLTLNYATLDKPAP